MATPVLTTDFTVISTCNTTDNWAAGSIGTDSDLYKQGGVSLAGTMRLSADNSTFTPPSAIDITNTHLRIWFLCTWVSMMDILANGGVQYFVSDGVNTGYWNMLGSDAYDGGWVLLVIYTGLDVDSGTKPDMSVITSLGLIYNQTADPKNVDNTWWDYFVYGDGYYVTGGSESDGVTLNDIYNEDATNGYGVLQKINGVYFLNGLLGLGDLSDDLDCYFEDTSEAVVFTDDRVDNTLYNIALYGGTNTSTSFQCGILAGSSGIQGLSFNAVGLQDYFITASGSFVDVFKLYGTSFRNAADVLLPTVASGSVLNCNFEECREVIPQNYEMQYCNFISSNGYALILSDTNHGVKNSYFITCSSGINITASGTYPFDNITFDGCDYDIVNSSGADVIIEALNGANPQSYINLYGGSVTIENSVSISIHVEDVYGSDVQNVRCAVFKESDESTILNEFTDVNGDAEANYNYLSDTDIIVRIRKSSLSSTRYKNFSTKGTITVYGYSLSVIVEEDLNID